MEGAAQSHRIDLLNSDGLKIWRSLPLPVLIRQIRLVYLLKWAKLHREGSFLIMNLLNAHSGNVFYISLVFGRR
jgi:hypothetical protein